MVGCAHSSSQYPQYRFKSAAMQSCIHDPDFEEAWRPTVLIPRHRSVAWSLTIETTHCNTFPHRACVCDSHYSHWLLVTILVGSILTALHNLSQYCRRDCTGLTLNGRSPHAQNRRPSCWFQPDSRRQWMEQHLTNDRPSFKWKRYTNFHILWTI